MEASHLNDAYKMSVAVVILNWNGKAYLQQFLPSVMQSEYPVLQVIVADNASTDDSIAWLQENYPSVKTIILPVNYGFAKGYNEALKQVTADVYVLLNSDVEVESNWINPVIQAFEKNPLLAACQPKILAYHNKDIFEYAGAAGGWIDNLGYPFARGRIMETCEIDKGQYDVFTTCFWATGAALFVKAELYHQLGGLDEYFFAHQEEIDLCWRIHNEGYEVGCEPSSVVYHVGAGTLAKHSPRKTYLNFRNNLVMISKNMLFQEKCWKMPLRFLLDGLAAIKFVASGELSHASAVVKAWVSFGGWVFNHSETKNIPASRYINSDGWYSGSVLWQYYVKGKKHFSEIISRK